MMRVTAPRDPTLMDLLQLQVNHLIHDHPTIITSAAPVDATYKTLLQTMRFATSADVAHKFSHYALYSQKILRRATLMI
jgi:hypothetical protein